MLFKNNKERLVCFRIQETILAKLTMKIHVIIYLMLASSFTYAIPLKVKLDHSSETQLHTNQQLVAALKAGNKDQFLKALAAGADPNYQINQSSSVLSLATSNLDSDFLNVLLQKGGNPNSFRVSARRHLIFEVLGPDRIEHLRTLLRFSPKLDVKDGTGSTPIIYAAILSNYTAMKLLIEKGADTSLKNNFGYDVLKVLEDNATRECHQSECSQLNEVKQVIMK